MRNTAFQRPLLLKQNTQILKLNICVITGGLKYLIRRDMNFKSVVTSGTSKSRVLKSSKYFEKTTRKKKEFKIFSFTENILSNICIPERNSGYFSFNTPCLDAFIHLGLCGQNVLIQNIKREAFVPATVQCFFSQSNLKTCQFVSTFNVCIQVGEKNTTDHRVHRGQNSYFAA